MEWIILLVLLSVVWAIYQPKIKGYFGERAVVARLAGLHEKEFKLINDVMLKTNYGTTQIDHIILSVYGIFVIETKNYKGWITGGENSEKWTKNMYGKKYAFRNPLKQNYAHIKALEEVLGLPLNVFVPIVVFANSATIKVKTNRHVVYMSQLRKVINNYKDIRFSYEEICSLEQRLLSVNIIDKGIRKEHVRQIKTKVSENSAKVVLGVCPKCGGKLIKRTGKYGAFYGCGNYPKCKYTRQV